MTNTRAGKKVRRSVYEQVAMYAVRSLLVIMGGALALVLVSQIVGWPDRTFIEFLGAQRKAIYLTTALVTLAVIALGLRYVTKKAPRRAAKVALGIFMAGAAILTTLVSSHALLSSNHGWDASTIADISRTYVETGAMAGEGEWNGTYLAKYENNVSIALIITFTYKLLSVFGDHYTVYLQALNIGALLFSLAAVVYVAKKRYGARAAVVAYFFGYILITLSAYIPITYTDTLGLFFVSLVTLLLHFTYEAKRIPARLVLAALLGVSVYWGYLVKPTVILLLIAGVGAALLAARARALKSFTIIAPFVGVVAGVFIGVQLYGLAQAAAPGLGGYTSDEIEQHATSLEHYLAMGSLRGLPPYEGCRAGGFCMDYVGYIQSGEESVDTIAERKQYAMSVWRDSVATNFPFGYAGHLINKAVYVYSDGSFGVWGEASDKRDAIVFHRNTSLDGFVRSFMGPSGEYLRTFRLVQHGVWLALLGIILVGLAVTLRRRGEVDFFTRFYVIAILLVTAFLMVFEARPRYLFLYLPVFILLASSQFSVVNGASSALWARLRSRVLTSSFASRRGRAKR